MEEYYNVKEVIEQITRVRGLERDMVVHSLRESLISAIQRSYKDPNYPVEVDIDVKTGKITIKVEKKVVKVPENSKREISLEEAKNYHPLATIGITIKVPIDLKEDLGRGPIQKARHLFVQKIQEAEKQHIYKDFQNRIGDIVSGMVRKVDKTGIYVGLGKVEAFLPPEEQIRKERFRPGQMIKALIYDVDTAGKRSIVKLSRTHPEFLRKLMELEVPELMEGLIEIKGIARMPGERAKVSVWSKDEKIDPLGACVGIKGTRIQTVTKELSGERIDIVKWDADIYVYTARALSPAHPVNVFEKDDKLIAVIPDEEIKIAKGVGSQNVLLASKLIGKEIWVISYSEFEGKKKVPVGSLICDEWIKEELKKEVDGIFSLEELKIRIKSLQIIQGEEELEKILENNRGFFENEE